MVTISDAHGDLIHDAQLDYYGKVLATCSSDKTVKLYELDGENKRLVDTLRGHDGPVWQVAWAHPKFGVLLASGSYDGKVIVWREESGSWAPLHTSNAHSASVNSVQFAPSELGLLLLSASSDGSVSLLELKNDTPGEPVVAPAHSVGVNAVSWAPVLPASRDPPRRFVTGGGDNLVKVWNFDGSKFVLEDTLEGHSDWVRDVAWSPSLLSKSYIASASQDKTVIIWTKDGDKPWQKKLLKSEKFPDVVWRVSWSLSGNILAVSGGDNKVTLWKENLAGDWESAGEVDA